MISSLETIVEDLVAGKITMFEAVTRLNAHDEDDTTELRDRFAAAALRSIASRFMTEEGGMLSYEAAMAAFEFADAMLEVRKQVAK